jgi:hypothetical protein
MKRFKAGLCQPDPAVFAQKKVQAGLRYEHTITDLRTFDNQPLVYRNYGNWFPQYSSLRILPNKAASSCPIVAGLTAHRLRQPGSLFHVCGPELESWGQRPLVTDLSDNFQTTYRFKKSFLLTLSYAQFNNAIAFMSTVIPDKTARLPAPKTSTDLRQLNFP